MARLITLNSMSKYGRSFSICFVYVATNDIACQQSNIQRTVSGMKLSDPGVKLLRDLPCSIPIPAQILASKPRFFIGGSHRVWTYSVFMVNLLVSI